MKLLEARNDDILAAIGPSNLTINSLETFQINSQADLTKFLERCQGVFVQTLLNAEAYLSTQYGIGKVESKGAGSIIARAAASSALKARTQARVIFDFTVTAHFPKAVGNPPADTKVIQAFTILDDDVQVVDEEGNRNTVATAELQRIFELARLAIRAPFDYSATMAQKLAQAAAKAARPNRAERAASAFRATLETRLPLGTTDEFKALGWLVTHTKSLTASIKNKYLAIFDEIFPGQPRSVADGNGELTTGSYQMKYSGSARLILTDTNVPKDVLNLYPGLVLDKAGAINNTAFIAGLINSYHFYFTSRERPFDAKKVFNAILPELNQKQAASFAEGCVEADGAFGAWLLGAGINPDAYTVMDVKDYIDQTY